MEITDINCIFEVSKFDNMIQRLFYIFIVLVLCSCSKGDEPYTPTRDNLIGKRFSSSVVSVEFVSRDSVEWLVDIYRDTPILYRAKYELSENRVTFNVRDTIRADYNDPMLGTPRFTKTYHTDNFIGTFSSTNTLNAAMCHAHEMLENDLNLIGSGVTKTSYDLKCHQ